MVTIVVAMINHAAPQHSSQKMETMAGRNVPNMYHHVKVCLKGLGVLRYTQTMN